MENYSRPAKCLAPAVQCLVELEGDVFVSQSRPKRA